MIKTLFSRIRELFSAKSSTKDDLKFLNWRNSGDRIALKPLQTSIFPLMTIKIIKGVHALGSACLSPSPYYQDMYKVHRKLTNVIAP